jgi:hypothetical protein
MQLYFTLQLFDTVTAFSWLSALHCKLFHHSVLPTRTFGLVRYAFAYVRTEVLLLAFSVSVETHFPFPFSYAFSRFLSFFAFVSVEHRLFLLLRVLFWD